MTPGNREREGNQPESILQRLQKLDPERNVAFTAVEQLKDPQEMQQFMDEYAKWLGENSDDEEIKRNPFQVAGSNVGYIVGYYDKATADRWFQAIEGLSHPIFGTNLPWNRPADAYETGQMRGRLSTGERDN
ncbi:MAG: hypothetical protein AAB414_04320 [Patescibacteria group bacterium]